MSQPPTPDPNAPLNVSNIYECTPRQVTKFATRIIRAGRVPFIRSSPGEGKSSLVHAIAEEFDLLLLDERLSTRSPVDLAGMPGIKTVGGKRSAVFTPFENFPIEGTPIPINPKTKQPYNGWLLFLDEFNSCSKATQAAAYKLVLDKMVGLDKLHPNVAIVCAGNLASDRAIVNDLSTAMQSRVIHLVMRPSAKQWLYDVAIPKSYDHRLLAYHQFTNFAHLKDFRPDHQELTFCCPRTWEFMNDLLTDPVTGDPLPIEEEDINMFAGTITPGIAADFVNYCLVYAELPSEADVRSSPATAKIPSELNQQWAMISMLMGRTDKSNFAAYSDYVERYSMDFKILYFRYILAKDRSLAHHPAFAKKASAISRYLND